MSATLSKWTQAVHDHCRINNCGLTPPETIRLFGNPPSISSASALLNSAMSSGWFRREEWQEEGRMARVYKSRYFAIEKIPTPARPAKARLSYFDGITRCRSVFELGETL